MTADNEGALRMSLGVSHARETALTRKNFDLTNQNERLRGALALIAARQLSVMPADIAQAILRSEPRPQ